MTKPTRHDMQRDVQLEEHRRVGVTQIMQPDPLAPIYPATRPLNARVIRSGDHGTDPSTANSSAASTNPNELNAASHTAPSLAGHPAKPATGRSCQRRSRSPVSSSSSLAPLAERRLASTSDRDTDNMCRSQSTSVHRNAASSPPRSPVAAARRIYIPAAGEIRSAAPIRPASCSTVGGSLRL